MPIYVPFEVNSNFVVELNGFRMQPGKSLLTAVAQEDGLMNYQESIFFRKTCLGIASVERVFPAELPEQLPTALDANVLESLLCQH